MFTNEELLAMIEEAGITAENIGEYYYSESEQQQSNYKKVIDVIKKYALEYYQRKFPSHEWNDVVDRIGLTEFGEFMKAAKELKNNSSMQDYDSRATEKALLDKITDKDDFKAWIYGKIAETQEQKGIRNDKDPFTPSGNRRTFSQLHDYYSVENIVKNMLRGEQTGTDSLCRSMPFS